MSYGLNLPVKRENHSSFYGYGKAQSEQAGNFASVLNGGSGSLPGSLHPISTVLKCLNSVYVDATLKQRRGRGIQWERSPDHFGWATGVGIYHSVYEVDQLGDRLTILPTVTVPAEHALHNNNGDVLLDWTVTFKECSPTLSICRTGILAYTKDRYRFSFISLEKKDQTNESIAQEPHPKFWLSA